MSFKLFKSTKGAGETTSNASGAAFLILLITIVIVFYLLFLPPADRAALLEGQTIPGTPNSASSGYSHLIGSTPLNERVGYIDYVKDDKIIHELSTFTIYTLTDAELISSVSSFYIKNSAFEKKFQEMRFEIDPKATENVKLSFNVDKPSGALKIYLNGILIFEGELERGTPSPLVLPVDLLKQNNVLYFAVSSPGFAFWSVNQYELENILVTGDITDSSNSFNMQKVYLAESEYKHLESAVFQFYPDCSNTNVGRIDITVNNQQVYHGVPDCGLKNFISLDKSVLDQGENKIEFVSDKGSYIIDMVELQSDLEDAQYPLYYFELDEDLFTDGEDDEVFCGKVDGICLDNCEAYEDKDCCFKESNRNYWCDIRTDNPRDRCVNMILANQGDDCLSGYEDRSGDPPEDLEGVCGDDTDDFCPTGCDYQYDKDCCFTIDNAFWCDDVPFTGMDSVCTTIVTPSECAACPDDYHDKDNYRPNCPAPTETINSDGEKELKAGVDVLFKIYFANQDYKRVDFVINGKELPVDTYSMLVQRNINQFVREGTNSVEIQPRRDIAIAQIKVAIE